MTQAPVLAGRGLPDEALDGALDPLHEEAKNADPGRGVGHLGTRATTAGKIWGGPWVRAPRKPWSPSGPRKLRGGIRGAARSAAAWGPSAGTSWRSRCFLCLWLVAHNKGDS